MQYKDLHLLAVYLEIIMEWVIKEVLIILSLVKNNTEQVDQPQAY